MVSKITVLELHFDGAQFGPKSTMDSTGEDDEPRRESEHETSSGRSAIRLLLPAAALAVLTVVGMVVSRRRRRGMDDETEAATDVDVADVATEEGQAESVVPQ